MDDKIVFEDNKTSNNDELLKENTPETIDYNKLYNINEKTTNIINDKRNDQYINNINNNYNQLDNNINNTNINYNNNTFKNNDDINYNKKTEKSNMNSLLFIFLIFIVIMGVIIFLFPLIGKLLVK